MEQGNATLLLLLVLGVSAWQACGTVAGGRGRPPLVPAILVFGDSIVDTGNNNAVLTLTKSDFSPYGKDLNGGVPTGRFSNGRIPPDFLASRLGLKDLVPAYLGTDLTDDDLLTGVSFASGGTGYDPLTSTLVVKQLNTQLITDIPSAQHVCCEAMCVSSFQAVLPMQEELNMFAEYKEKLAGIAGDDAAARIIAESLFIVCAGTDDIANNYYLAPVRPLQYDISAYVDFLVHQASDFVKQLYQEGARKIAILGLPPVGCVPSQRTLAGGLARDCDQARNRAAQLFNAKLQEEIGRLQKELRCHRVGYVDIYDVLQDLITNPCKYGFDVSTRGCCGTGEFEVSILCNRLTATTCPDDQKFVFWDSFHPTERAYEIIVDYLYPRYIEKLL